MKHALLAALLLLTTTLHAAGRAQQDDELAQTLRTSHVKSEGKRAVVWTPSNWPDEKRAAITNSLDQLIPKVEQTLGKSFDAAAYKQQRIEYFVTDSDEIPSHVHGGYSHSPAGGHEPRVFLSGVDSGEAPHIHETAHIIGGQFGSLLLREGIATWTQFTLQPGKMRPLVNLGNVTDLQSLDAAMPRVLAKPANRELAAKWLNDPAKSVAFDTRPQRSLFYAVSASFVAHLIQSAGLATTMEAYAANDPKAVIEKRTGKPWAHWTAEWLARMTGNRP